MWSCHLYQKMQLHKRRQSQMEAENTWGLIKLLESLLHFRNRKDFEKHGGNAWTAGLFSNLQLQLPRQIKNITYTDGQHNVLFCWKKSVPLKWDKFERPHQKINYIYLLPYLIIIILLLPCYYNCHVTQCFITIKAILTILISQ